ncbi:MAG: SpoVT / AbrB like domain protein [Candidatus Methanofastidiosum methylothiophilum]|uniref:SpoVT / AbrB like domain protein n=1 Tax=Candidatus Methanofastidiosum methylothiophilum TaxID=1705564 RepID=A0A150J6K5_9EURY|nr:MAG: SpoVT / AbrB like domain protein [Candidatus Methanofastidiosum methylthiophilus]
MVTTTANPKEAFTRVSSKGQIVIPKDIRENLDIQEGDLLAAVSEENFIILKKVNPKITEEERILLKRIKEAWDSIDSGDYKEMEGSELLEEMKKW